MSPSREITASKLAGSTVELLAVQHAGGDLARPACSAALAA